MMEPFVPPETLPNIWTVDTVDTVDNDDDDIEPARKGIRPQSAKSKGRRLQQWAAIRFKETFPHLQGNDVRSLSMGASGDDLILSTAALQVLPYNFEMKNVESFQQWATLRQVNKRRDTTATLPCMVVKRNRIDPVVIVPFGHLLHLLRLETTPARTSPPPPPVEEMTSAKSLLTAFDLTGAAPAQCLHMAIRAGLQFALSDPQAVSDVQPGILHVAGRWTTYAREKERFNFWKEWDALVLRHKPKRTKKAAPPLPPVHPLLIFNRGDVDACIFAALPFDAFLLLLQARWRHFGPQ